MSDFLVEMSTNPVARSVVRTLGLPVSFPPTLRRNSDPWSSAPLSGRNVLVRQPADSLLPGLVETLSSLGATTSTYAGTLPADGLVLDATAIDRPEQLRFLYDELSLLTRHLARGGKLVVLGSAVAEATSAAGAAARRAIEGFVRSLSKELGRKGQNVNLIEVGSDGKSSLPLALSFLLSDRCAFVTGQVVRLSGGSGEAAAMADAPLAGQVALVTGGARGIGEQAVHKLAQCGAHVLVVDRPGDDALAGVAAEVGGTALAVDVRAPDAAATIAAAVAELGGVDVVVHNAGVTRDKTLARMRPEAWDMVLDINLEAILRIDEALLQGGYKDGARVVLLSSVGGIAGNPGQTNYGATKAGLIGYAAHRSAELAARGITVNAVAPGFIETRMTAAMPVAIREAARRLSSLNQGGQPEDVAELICFLSHPGSRGIVGQTIRVCGGALIGA